jgi:hypothetical protein
MMVIRFAFDGLLCMKVRLLCMEVLYDMYVFVPKACVPQ